MASRSVPEAGAALVAALVLALGLAVGGAAPAHAAKPGRDASVTLDRTVRYLQDTQNPDGGYGGDADGRSSPLFSAWVGIGLAAAGINPQDQEVRPGRDVARYVAKAGPQNVGSDGQPLTTEYERIGMFVNAAGLDMRRFGGRDYLTPLVARQRASAWTSPSGTTIPAGWFPHTGSGRSPGVNDTIFAVIALGGASGGVPADVIPRAADAILAMQREDGTWPAVSPSGPTDVDMTGAAVQALCIARRCGTPAVSRAIAWLRAHQHRDGGWSADGLGAESNSGTTPWVVQALWATGRDPARWRRGGTGRDPLAYFRSMQQADGRIVWKDSDTELNPTWMTAYAMPALAGQAWPVKAAPRAAVVRAQRAKARAARVRARAAAARKGRGGATQQGDGDVVAGGGGRGAEDFTRPQAQSQGATGGGVRDTERAQSRRASTKGDRDGATGTAATSGRDRGGTQNPDGERAAATSSANGGAAVDGVVVSRSRGAKGRARDEAIAPGLRSASAGATGTPWGAIGLGSLVVVLVGAGTQLERRRPAGLA